MNPKQVSPNQALKAALAARQQQQQQATAQRGASRNAKRNPSKATWAAENLNPKPLNDASAATAERLRELLASAAAGGRLLCRFCPKLLAALDAALASPCPYRCGGDCLARARQVRYAAEAWLDWFDEQQTHEVEPA